MSATASIRRRPASQPGASLDTGISKALPHKPSSALKKEGWSGFMREVSAQGILVVTHRNQAEAVVLSVDSYQALERLAQREKEREAQQLAELSARFDQRLASLHAQQAHQAVDTFMDEPIALGGKLHAGAAY
jgi:PHD/YefM family antitoxin component YafN of YafNO toxin-antitoxin module